jgi:hypothetical protein
MIVYRHADPRFPFLWESELQPPGRWHRTGEGPVQYFADTPDGAWAEFLRHEGIRTENEIANVRRALWAVEIPDDQSAARPLLPSAVMTAGIDSYASCQEESRRLRAGGATILSAPSAALLPGEARGWKVEGGLRPGPCPAWISTGLFRTPT